jgi:hypothetical protein
VVGSAGAIERAEFVVQGQGYTSKGSFVAQASLLNR